MIMNGYEGHHEDHDETINRLLGDDPTPAPVPLKPTAYEAHRPSIRQGKFASLGRTLGKHVMHQLDLIMTGQSPDCWPFKK